MRSLMLSFLILTLQFLSGCAALTYYCAPIPESQFKEMFPWPVYNLTRADVVAISTISDNIGVGVIVWMPIFIVEVPCSIIIDTFTIPFQYMRYEDINERSIN